LQSLCIAASVPHTRFSLFNFEPHGAFFSIATASLIARGGFIVRPLSTAHATFTHVSLKFTEIPNSPLVSPLKRFHFGLQQGVYCCCSGYLCCVKYILFETDGTGDAFHSLNWLTFCFRADELMVQL
jgi:hypothetical protein